MEIQREKSLSNIFGKGDEHDQISEKIGSMVHLPLILQYLSIVLQNQLPTVFIFRHLLSMDKMK